MFNTVGFTEAELSGMEWQQTISHNTSKGEYRVEVSWALDRYRVKVFRRVQEPEKLRAVRVAFYLRTATKTANRLLRAYSRQENVNLCNI